LQNQNAVIRVAAVSGRTEGNLELREKVRTLFP